MPDYRPKAIEALTARKTIELYSELSLDGADIVIPATVRSICCAVRSIARGNESFFNEGMNLVQRELDLARAEALSEVSAPVGKQAVG